MYGHPDAVRPSVQMAIHFFVDFDVFKWLYLAYFWVGCISLKTGLINTELGDFVNPDYLDQ